MQSKITSEFLLLLLIVWICAISCKSKTNIDPKETINIVQIVDAGNHTYCLILGSDSAEVKFQYDGIAFYSDTLSKSFQNHQHILSQKAIDFIWSFIQDNCTPADKNKALGENVYYIGRPVDAPLEVYGCTIKNMELGKAYFSKLILSLNNSPYKMECSYLIKDIQAKFVEDKPFPLTPYHQHKLDSINNSQIVKENNLSK